MQAISVGIYDHLYPTAKALRKKGNGGSNIAKLCKHYYGFMFIYVECANIYFLLSLLPFRSLLGLLIFFQKNI